MLKNHEVTTRAVIVGRMPSGEGSVRVLLYTEEHGLVRALATSAREERSKLRPHLQVGTYGYFTLVKGSYDWRVIGADRTQNVYFDSGVMNLPQACSRVFTVLRQLIHGEDANEPLFSALWGLVGLPELSAQEVRVAEHIAMVRILTSLGYVPTQVDIPHIETDLYTKEVLADLSKSDKKMVHVINEALLASGLS